jgi:uncharacterized DUF497 family protein
MRALPWPSAFQWDEGNLLKNFEKHNVTVQEAEEVFASEPFVTLEDTRHSTDTEKRFQALGKTKTNRRLFVAFTIRNKHIRVISIRDMTKKEGLAYEQFEAHS